MCSQFLSQLRARCPKRDLGCWAFEKVFDVERYVLRDAGGVSLCTRIGKYAYLINTYTFFLLLSQGQSSFFVQALIFAPNQLNIKKKQISESFKFTL